jgi:multiple sugar transport system permease protein
MTQQTEAVRSQEIDWEVVGQKALRIVGRTILYVVLLAGAAIFAAPFVWMLSTSLMEEHFAYTVPPTWIPPRVMWSNYTNSWNFLPFATFYKNTLFLTVVNIIGLVLSSSLVAFGFARIRFWGRDKIFLLLLSTMMLPAQVTMIPIYLFWSRFHAINTFWPLIVPEWLTNAYNVFLLRQFFMTISPEMDDAARMDGCGWLGIYWRILMPMARPALGVIAIQAFAWNWNNFMGPLIYLNTPTRYTVAIGLRLFQTRFTQNMPMTMAMSIVAVIPVLIMFFVAQKRYIQGIVITGVKG